MNSKVFLEMYFFLSKVCVYVFNFMLISPQLLKPMQASKSTIQVYDNNISAQFSNQGFVIYSYCMICLYAGFSHYLH